MLRPVAHATGRYRVLDVPPRSASDRVGGRRRRRWSWTARSSRSAATSRRSRRAGLQPTSFNPHPIAGSFEPDDKELSDVQRAGLLGAGVREPRVQRGTEAGAAQSSTSGSRATRRSKPRATGSSHMIGSASLARYEGNVSQAFTAGSASCAAGYYHGILERALVGVGTKAELVQAVRRLCADADVRATRLRRLPVRPWARARADDPHRARPAAVALDLRAARDRLGSDLLRRRRLHGELQLLVRRQVALPPRRTTRSIPATPSRSGTSSTATSR